MTRGKPDVSDNAMFNRQNNEYFKQGYGWEAVCFIGAYTMCALNHNYIIYKPIIPLNYADILWS